MKGTTSFGNDDEFGRTNENENVYTIGTVHLTGRNLSSHSPHEKRGGSIPKIKSKKKTSEILPLSAVLRQGDVLLQEGGKACAFCTPKKLLVFVAAISLIGVTVGIWSFLGMGSEDAEVIKDAPSTLISRTFEQSYSGPDLTYLTTQEIVRYEGFLAGCTPSYGTGYVDKIHTECTVHDQMLDNHRNRAEGTPSDHKVLWVNFTMTFSTASSTLDEQQYLMFYPEDFQMYMSSKEGKEQIRTDFMKLESQVEIVHDLHVQGVTFKSPTNIPTLPLPTPLPTSSPLTYPSPLPSTTPSLFPTTHYPTTSFTPTLPPTLTDQPSSTYFPTGTPSISLQPTTLPSLSLKPTLSHLPSTSHLPTSAPTDTTCFSIGEFSGTQSKELFGTTVAISGNGKRVAIGIPFFKVQGREGAGKVEVYDMIGENQWLKTFEFTGKNSGERVGQGVDLNQDGSVLAVGCPKMDFVEGFVLVFQYRKNKWVAMGEKLSGKSQYGWSLSLSNDGQRLAVGDAKGEAKSFEFRGDKWESLGDKLRGESYASVSFSGDGRRIAVGHPTNDFGYEDAGEVKVFEYSEEMDEWILLGNKLYGKMNEERFGWQVSLSKDGERVAVGTRGANFVQVFEYTAPIDRWKMVGDAREGEEKDFGRAMALSQDGKRLIVGSAGYSTFGLNDGQGRAIVYRFEEEDWEQIFKDILGKEKGDHMGESLDINQDGKMIVIGAPGNAGGRGIVYVVRCTGD